MRVLLLLLSVLFSTSVASMTWSDGYKNHSFREYINATIIGQNLSAAHDEIFWSETDCQTLYPSELIIRKSSLEQINTSAVRIIFQVAPPIGHTSSLNLQICYVPVHTVVQTVEPLLALSAASPGYGEVIKPHGGNQLIRQGGSLFIELKHAQENIEQVKFVKFGEFCGNSSNKEPLVSTVNNTVNISYIKNQEYMTMCVRNKGHPWADIATNPYDASRFLFYRPSVEKMRVIPAEPVVGQPVLLDFYLNNEYELGDNVIVAEENSAVPCQYLKNVIINDNSFSNRTVQLFSALYVVNNNMKYGSFMNPGTYTVCYNSVGDGDNWVAVGGSLESARITVKPTNPLNWTITQGVAIIYKPFTISIKGEGLKPNVDKAWLAASSETCANSECASCIPLTFNEKLSTQTNIVTNNASVPHSYGYQLCYQSNNETAVPVGKYIIFGPAPQLPVSPSTWVPSTKTPHFREWINATFFGENIDANRISITISELPCGNQHWIKTVQTAAVQVAKNAVNVSFQLLPRNETQAQQNITEIYVCRSDFRNLYNQIPVLKVGAPLSGALSLPLHKTVTPTPRQGEKVQFEIKQTGAKLTQVKIIQRFGPHGCTDGKNIEPTLQVIDLSKGLLEVSAMRSAASFIRLCTKYEGAPWSDAAFVPVSPSGVYVAGPAVTYTPLPEIIRVGEQVKLSLSMTGHRYVKGDVIKIVLGKLAKGVSCLDAKADAHVNASELKPLGTGPFYWNAETVLLDDRDVHKYSSFTEEGEYTVCYYSAGEQQWSLAGGTEEAATITVQESCPASWSFQSPNEKHAVPGKPFTLVAKTASKLFRPELTSAGVLNPKTDHMWLAPSNAACCSNITDCNCDSCVDLPFAQNQKPGTSLLTAPITLYHKAEYQVCYELESASAASLPGILSVSGSNTTVEIKCFQPPNSTFSPGKAFNIDVDIAHSTICSNDSLVFSKYQAPVNGDFEEINCEPHIIHNYPKNNSKLIKNEPTVATWQVKIPSSGMDSPFYAICYRHNGVWRQLSECSGAVYVTETSCHSSSKKGAVVALGVIVALLLVLLIACIVYWYLHYIRGSDSDLHALKTQEETPHAEMQNQTAYPPAPGTVGSDEPKLSENWN